MAGVARDDEKLNRDLCKSGAKVFYFEANHAWALGVVEKDDGKLFTVKGTGFNSTEVAPLETTKVSDKQIWPAREDVLDEDVRDLLDLTVLHDSTIQRCLFLRYMKDMVYTNIGQIVVALNPWNFKISWYTDDNMPKYLAEGEVIKENVPHSWAQAHNTYNDMKREAENQTILISGESGAGKTEAAKIVMKYLGSVSCLQGAESAKEAARKVAFNINQASPILEGFGNAKTVRNDNSSRFGKFMKVQFDDVGFLVGAYTIKYLLEKSRIVTANPNERVYHSFYLLLKGKDKSRYQLSDPSNYHVNAGGCIDIPGVDDGDDYRICLESMTNCGFSEMEQNGVWKCIGGILHLLQVKFSALDADSCKIEEGTVGLVDLTANMWEVNADTLRTELVTTTMETRDGPVTKKLTTVKAADSRDAVVKATYDELFSWQVNKINKITDSGTGTNFIGLLDIFGFEDFEYNSFEQLCINLANETLQNHYNTFIFTKDMEECKAEGVNVTEVKCPDNSPCLAMIAQKSGILHVLDDECSLGQGSDAGFLDKVLDAHASNPFFSQKKLSKNSFIVHHYAASVNYTVENWLEKNRDTLKKDMKLMMRASQHSLIASLIPEPDDNAKKVTTGGFFKQQLVELMALINSTQPHWIRCVKPHPAKRPLMVDGVQTMTQLESSGVLGTVKIRKAGFPVRITYQKFIARFKCILGGGPPPDSPLNVMQEFCKKVVAKAEIDPLKGQCGKTKMFLKNEANQRLEAVREAALRTHVVCLHKHAWTRVSELVVRKQRWVWGVKKIQEEVRDWLQRSIAERAERERQRQELLETLKSVLEPFEEEWKAATKEVEEEETREWEALMAENREFLGTKVAEVMRQVTSLEEENRAVIEAEEEEERESFENTIAAEKTGLMFKEIEFLEERLRNDIEREWWNAELPMKPAEGGLTMEWEEQRDVTRQVLGDEDNVAQTRGMKGLLEEFLKMEIQLVEEDRGDWSEPYNRNIIKKEELTRRRFFNQQFTIGWTEARLTEEQVFEMIWRADVADTEDTRFRSILQAFYTSTLRQVEAPNTFKGLDSEPACRKLIEKERRDTVRKLYAAWKSLKYQTAESYSRRCIDQQCDLSFVEIEKRANVEISEMSMRDQVCTKKQLNFKKKTPPQCREVYEPFQQNMKEKRELREKRQLKRDRKMRALHKLWVQENERLERERYGDTGQDWRDQSEELINVLNRYREVAGGVQGYGEESQMATTATKRKIADFGEYMRRVEEGEDVEMEESFTTTPETLWGHLRSVQAEGSPRASPSPALPTPVPPTPLDVHLGVADGGYLVRPDLPSPSRGNGRPMMPSPLPPLPVDTSLPFLDQVIQHVSDIHDTVADADLFREAMRHSNARVGLGLDAIPQGNTERVVSSLPPWAR